MEIKNIEVSALVHNNGQIEGLPANPRRKNKAMFEKLVASIEETPEMLSLRELLVYPYDNKYIVIAGNMRLEAIKQIGYAEAPCKVLDVATPVEALKAYTIKDNVSFGDWDFDKIGEDWADFAQEYNLEAPVGLNWGNGKKSYCDLKPKVEVHKIGSALYHTTFKKAKEGEELQKIKENLSNVEVFAEQAEDVIRGLIGLNKPSDICIVTTPKRRHMEQNFSELVCIELSKRLNIKFYADAVEAANRHRIEPNFKLVKEIPESYVILYDDIITTGSTISATAELLPDKNIIYVIGVYNK